MSGFASFLKSGNLREATKKKDKAAAVKAPRGKSDAGDDKVSRMSSFLKSGDLRSSKKRSSGSGSPSAAQSTESASAAAPSQRTSTGQSRQQSAMVMNGEENPATPLWMSPLQRRQTSAASVVSGTSATRISADGRLSSGGAGSSALGNTRNGSNVPVNTTEAQRTAAFDQDDTFSMISHHGGPGLNNIRELASVPAPVALNGGTTVARRAPASTTVVAAFPRQHERVQTISEDDGEFSEEEDPNAPTPAAALGANGTTNVSIGARRSTVIGDSVSQAQSIQSDALSEDMTAAPAAPIYVQSTLAPYRPVEGDDDPIYAPAIRYSFETSTMCWTKDDIYLRILHPNRGYDQDDLHVYFAVEQVINAKTCIPMVAKAFRRIIKEVREDDYFGEGQCQALTEAFARQFNRLKPRPSEKKPVLPLLTSRTVVRITETNVPVDQVGATSGFFSYRTSDTNEVLFMMEPNTVECMQTGVAFSAELNMTSYPPLNVSKTAIRELAEAFSHFTFSNSANQLLVTGLQRYAGYLVDPLVYTTDKKGYGMANGGAKSIATWSEKHTCTPVCRSIGLTPIPATLKPPAQTTIDRNFYVSLSGYIIDYRDTCVPKAEVALVARAEEEAEKPKRGHEPFVGKATPRIDIRPKPIVTAPEVVEVPRVVAKPTPAPAHVDPEVRPPPPAPKAEVPPPVVTPQPVTPTTEDPSIVPVTLKGYKYYFVAETQRWFPVEVTVVVKNPNRPVLRDRESKVFAVEQVVADTVTTQMFARVLNIEDVVDADYFNIMDAYVLCSTLAQSFNEYRQTEIYKKFIHFMERSVVRVPYTDIADDDWSRAFFKNPSQDSKDVLFILEPANFQSLYERALEEYNLERTEVGAIDSDDDYDGSRAARGESEEKAKSRALNETIEWKQVLETFYHFCYVRTGRYLCVKDASFANAIMPCENIEDAKVTDGSLVNPCVHTFDGNGFVHMNEGNSAVQKWVRGHKCNALCSLLGLPGVTSTVPFTGTTATKGPAAQAAKRDAQRIAQLPRNIGMHYIYPATKYTFDAAQLRWVPSKIFVRVVDPDRGFAMGAMRVVFEVTECSSGLSQFETPYLAKLFRHNIADVVERDYFNEGALQNLCHEFGKKFSTVTGECGALKPRGDTTQLEFVPVSIVTMARETLPDELYTKRKGFFSYKTKDTQKIMFTIEERIEGRFTKYNSNGAGVYLNSETKLTPQESRRRTHILEAAEALSHYSLSETKGALLVCDLQGVGTTLTDPEIHTFDGQGLGIGNRGREGMVDFVTRHRCNFVCKSLGLPPFNMRVPEVRDPDSNPYVQKLQDLQNMPTAADPPASGRSPLT